MEAKFEPLDKKIDINRDEIFQKKKQPDTPFFNHRRTEEILI